MKLLYIEDEEEKAKEIDEKKAKGEDLGLLAGIPIGIKDNICTKGINKSYIFIIT